MHLYLYQANTQLTAKQFALEKLIASLPIYLQGRAKRYQSEQAAINYSYGRILLRKGFEDLIEDHSLDQVMVADNGKPYHDDIFFNISHSAYEVVCALSLDGEVGVDIEKMVPVELQNFKSSFTEKEWNIINAATEPLEMFYRMWTRKESIIKATGHGLPYLNKVELDHDKDLVKFEGKEWHLTELDCGKRYQGTVCTEFPVESLEIVHC